MGSQAGGGLVSCGYEGRTIGSFVDALVVAGVGVVADVRLTPLSRKPGFSKTRLAEALAAADIDYLHLRCLGNPKSNREPFWSGRAEEGCAVFRDLLVHVEAVAALDRLVVLSAQMVVAVLCFEHDEGLCHRQVVMEEVSRDRMVAVSALA